MNYKIEVSRAAYKALKDIPLADLRRIHSKIEKLKKEPFPNGSEKLEGNEELFRIRSGDYRVIYQVLKARLLILIVKIGHRREIYR